MVPRPTSGASLVAKHWVLGSVSRDFDAGTPIAHGRNRQSNDTLIILLGLAGLEQVSGKILFGI